MYQPTAFIVAAIAVYLSPPASEYTSFGGGERIRHGAPLLIRQSKLGDRAVAISLLIAQLPRDASARTTAVFLSGLLALPLTAGWSRRKQAQKLSSASRGILRVVWI